MDLTPLTLLVQRKHFSINTFRERKKKPNKQAKQYMNIYIYKKKGKRKENLASLNEYWSSDHWKKEAYEAIQSHFHEAISALKIDQSGKPVILNTPYPRTMILIWKKLLFVDRSKFPHFILRYIHKEIIWNPTKKVKKKKQHFTLTLLCMHV